MKYKDIKVGQITKFWKIKIGDKDVFIPDELIERIVKLIFK